MPEKKSALRKEKLTDPIVRAAEFMGPGRERVIWDTDVAGFGLRIRGSAKSYIVAYRVKGTGRNGTSKRLTLGSVDSVQSVKEARL
jgi:hypothetical protein